MPPYRLPCHLTDPATCPFPDTSSSDSRPRTMNFRRDPAVARLLHAAEISTLYHPVHSAHSTRSSRAPPVPYSDHPHAARRRLRSLAPTAEDYAPLRLHFDTATLVSRTDVDAPDSPQEGTAEPEVAFVMEVLLPRLQAFFRSALDVVPVSGSLLIDSYRLVEAPDGSKRCGHVNFGEVPKQHMEKGVEETDVVVYVSGSYGEINSEPDPFCDGSSKTLAVAVSCNTDQYDRPIAGSIHFCLRKIREGLAGGHGDLKRMVDYNVDVAKHEMAHILGMSYNSYRYFRDSNTGEPLTDRPIHSATTTCMDGTERMEPIPSSKILQITGTVGSPRRRAHIVTPTVRQVARNHFDCQTMPGAQLENLPTGPSCFGDHWDERAYYSDSLSAVLSPDINYFSPLTLALFEDSGWYRSNFSMAEISPWGHAAGCEFLEDDCINLSGEIPDFGKGFFCNSAKSNGCNAGHTHKASCNILTYPADATIPLAFQYFRNPLVGGLAQANFCPIFNSYHESFDCRIPSNSPDQKGYGNFYGESWGSNSRCFHTATGEDEEESRCYPHACVKDEHVLKLLIRDKWYTCSEDFEVIDVSDYRDLRVTCPRLSSVCPDMFCPANCVGKGICKYAPDRPGAPPRASCECDDPEDKSPGCSPSLVINKTWVDTLSEPPETLEGVLFDPLLQLFETLPDQWTNRSWAWAGTLIVLVGIVSYSVTRMCFGKRDRIGVSGQGERHRKRRNRR